MFKWKVEDLKLYNEVLKSGEKYYDHLFDCESKFSKKDKIRFIDEHEPFYPISYIVGVVKKFNADYENLPKIKTKNGMKVKPSGLREWLKENDPKKRFNTDKKCGCLYSKIYIEDIDIDSYINSNFHSLLLELYNEESRYFLTHDEYTVTLDEAKIYVRDYGGFGSVIRQGSALDRDESSYLYVFNRDGNKRKLTLDEMKSIVEKGRQVKALIDSLSENPIEF